MAPGEASPPRPRHGARCGGRSHHASHRIASQQNLPSLSLSLPPPGLALLYFPMLFFPLRYPSPSIHSFRHGLLRCYSRPRLLAHPGRWLTHYSHFACPSAHPIKQHSTPLLPPPVVLDRVPCATLLSHSCISVHCFCNWHCGKPVPSQLSRGFGMSACYVSDHSFPIKFGYRV